MTQPTSQLFLSSGDLIADRRYARAQDFLARGDFDAAADLLTQAVEAAPRFASAWFALGDVRELLGDANGAVAAFAQARTCDPEDRHGAGLRLARLGASELAGAMTAGYVRAVFDQYAADFDRALIENLNYCAPQLLFAAVMDACRALQREPYFDRALDLGCGTGLCGAAFWRRIDSLVGVDLSPRMLAMAEQKGCYNALHAADMQEFLRAENERSADLALAADALVYIADLAPVCRQVARVLDYGGLFAFTVETHAGKGVVLGKSLRYAHAQQHVEDALAGASLAICTLAPAATRTEAGDPVPGLLAVACRRSPQ